MLRDALTAVKKKGTRAVVARTIFFMPETIRRRIERRLRGREEFRSLHAADMAVVSCGKSGRTWFRVLLSRFFQLRFELGGAILLNDDNMHHRHRDIPRIFFTHDTYLRYYTGNFSSRIEYRKKPTLLIVRHPAAVAVSQYHQWKNRILPHKKWLNEYPRHRAPISIMDLVMHENAGLPYIVHFLNLWQRECRMRDDCTVIRYEDMIADPRHEFRRLINFVGFEPSEAEVEDCIAYASFENMREMEKKGVYFFSGRAMKMNRSTDSNAYKIRQGRAHGWRDELTAEQVAEVERYIEEHLDPGFGYLARERRSADEATATCREPSRSSERTA